MALRQPRPTAEVLGVVILPLAGYGPPPGDAGAWGLGLRLQASAILTLSGLALWRIRR